MNDESTKKPAGAVRPYEVGYGKPPVHTRFKKGVSGNPRGGSRKVKLRRARGRRSRKPTGGSRCGRATRSCASRPSRP